MQAYSKIKLDRTVGGAVALFLNISARILGFILRRNHVLDPSKIKVICVSKYAGLGSTLCSGPLLQSIKSSFPRAKLVFISSQNNAALLECMPVIDIRLYVSERSIISIVSSSLAVLCRLWRLRPEMYLDLEIYSFYSSSMATLSCAINRYGFYNKSAKLKKGQYTHLVFFNIAAPVRSLYLQLGHVAGCQVRENSFTGLIKLGPEEDQRAAEVMEEWLPQDAPLFIVNPNASDLLLERRWPLESFASAISSLVEMVPGLRVALVGSPSETDYIAQLGRLLYDYRGQIREYAGLPLPTFLALLRKADCFLTNDSGPMHMAFDFRVPTVALFGPASPGHLASHADRSRTIILYEPVLCSPCIHSVDRCPCNGDNQCMKMITVPSVVEACFSFLRKTPHKIIHCQQWPLPKALIALSSPDGSPLGGVNLRARNY
jgi:ADP-heptose:LPS heptosyltransferase